MKSKVAKLFRMPPRQIAMLFEAWFLTAYYRFLVLYTPFSNLSKKIGTKGYETPSDTDFREIGREIRAAVDIICRHTPWESKCLVRALTAKKMLNRRGCPCTLYMGVTQNSEGKMGAHAWLRCGGIYVAGGNGYGFAVTGIFGDKQ